MAPMNQPAEKQTPTTDAINAAKAFLQFGVMPPCCGCSSACTTSFFSSSMDRIPPMSSYEINIPK